MKFDRISALFLAIAGTVFAQSGSARNAATVGAAASGGGVIYIATVVGSFASVFFGPASPALLAPHSLAVIYYSGTATGGTATVSLRPVGSATTIPAQVVAVDTTMNTITFVVPASAPLGPAQLIYKVSGGTTNWIEVAIVPAAFALFGSGSFGPLQAQMVNGDGSVALNGLATPTRPGQVVALWGSGLGSTPAANVGITLGGVPQSVLYAGASPSVPGVDQINFRVAPNTPDGCYVPLTVTWGQGSLTSFLSKTSDGSVCAHPLQLAASDLKTLDNGGTVPAGLLDTTSNVSVASAAHASRQESASASFTGLDAATLAGYFGTSVAFGCGVTPTPSLLNAVLFEPINFFADTLSNGGTTLLFTGTGEITLPSSDAPLTGLPAPVLTGGNWTYGYSGGSVTFALPPPLQLSSSVPLELTRTQDQTIAWNPAGYDANAIVTVTLTGTTAYTPLLRCTAPARAGTLTIPKSLLAPLTPTAATLSAQLTESVPLIGQHAQSGGLPILVFPTTGDSRPADIQ